MLRKGNAASWRFDLHFLGLFKMGKTYPSNRHYLHKNMLISTNLSSKATTIVSGASAIVSRLEAEEDVAHLIDTVNTNHDIYTARNISGVIRHLSTLY
jgi:hypothetical protein